MIGVEDATLPNALKIFVEIHLNLPMTKVLATGFDGSSTDMEERNGVKVYLRQWNPYINSF